ncbi:MAG: prefoldin subunit alpha [Methanobacteriota archaeon]
MEQAELEDKLALLEQYKTLLERLAKQDEGLRAELEEHMRARDTLQRLDQMKKGEELLVPIGANCFVYASVKNARKVINSVGSGVAVEDTVKKAIERLDDAVKQLNEAGQKLAERVQEMDGKARELAAEVDQAYQQMTHKH